MLVRQRSRIRCCLDLIIFGRKYAALPMDPLFFRSCSKLLIQVLADMTHQIPWLYLGEEWISRRLLDDGGNNGASAS